MKGMFFDGEFQSSGRISHRSENFGFHCCVTPIIITSMFMLAMYGIELLGVVNYFVHENCELVF